MSEKLGFTFYPKDWWTSDTFFELDFTERYIFLECMFMMYQNDGVMKTQKTHFEKRNSISVTDEQWKNVTDKFLIVDGMYTLLSVNKRLKKAVTNRENGSKGGRPPKPKKPSLETQNNPPSERERESEYESEEEKEIEGELQQPQHNFYLLSEFRKTEIGLNGFTKLATQRCGKSISEISVMFNTFCELQEATSKIFWKNESDAKMHFLNWAGKQKKNSGKNDLAF